MAGNPFIGESDGMAPEELVYHHWAMVCCSYPSLDILLCSRLFAKQRTHKKMNDDFNKPLKPLPKTIEYGGGEQELSNGDVVHCPTVEVPWNADSHQATALLGAYIDLLVGKVNHLVKNVNVLEKQALDDARFQLEKRIDLERQLQLVNRKVDALYRKGDLKK